MQLSMLVFLLPDKQGEDGGTAVLRGAGSLSHHVEETPANQKHGLGLYMNK